MTFWCVDAFPPRPGQRILRRQATLHQRVHLGFLREAACDDVVFLGKGRVGAAQFDGATQPSNQDIIMQAKMGVVSMTSSLMTALFGLQEDKG